VWPLQKILRDFFGGGNLFTTRAPQGDEAQVLVLLSLRAAHALIKKMF
jgi:hypothetical protein